MTGRYRPIRAAGPRRLRRAFSCAGAAAGLALVLAGCSPEYNWREIKATTDGYAVMLPAKPSSATRRINLEGLSIEMTMQGASAADNSFAVGTVKLPADDDAARAKAAGAMRAQMVRNIAGKETASAQFSVPVVDRAGVKVGAALATRIEATGQAQGKPAVLLAGFVARGARVYQYLVLGPNPDREQAAVFLDSFKLIE